MRARQDIKTTEPTRYEVALIRDGKILEVLGFTARKTKLGILSLKWRDLTEHLTELELESEYKYSAKYGFKFGDGSIRIGFTGRTERECAM